MANVSQLNHTHDPPQCDSLHRHRDSPVKVCRSHTGNPFTTIGTRLLSAITKPAKHTLFPPINGNSSNCTHCMSNSAKSIHCHRKLPRMPKRAINHWIFGKLAKVASIMDFGFQGILEHHNRHMEVGFNYVFEAILKHSKLDISLIRISNVTEA